MANPMVPSDSTPPPQISKKDIPVSGLICSVYGLEEIPSQATEVSCLYLLHPRSNTRESMEWAAIGAVAEWNRRLASKQVAPSEQNKGLVAVSFDQRNHGSREVDKLCNESWRGGNPNHAQDMFAIFNGTTRDVSTLIDYMGCYLFPKSERKITNNLVLGASLGGHAAWGCILHEPRITSATIIVGCPDYINLMTDRAERSKLATWTSSSPPGSHFLGSEAFPQPLIDTLKNWDPTSFFLNHISEYPPKEPKRSGPIPDPTEEEKNILRPVVKRCLAGKKILVLSGGADKLVPYARGEPFLTWLKKAIGPEGWCAEGKISLEDIIFEGVGHQVTPPMRDEAVKFIGDCLAAGQDSSKSAVVRTSKM
ncbi:hypothetical protein TEQG_01587 [Trichophyton equinum CBS 127.97]|uniref:AB hydrolase-1 domain-containing protein n=1 Tax=Trichophyton equinum (strain ATCC MYA-4606 / CBS 127.97) TaxID=559882 RepID=F2PKV5_TRIEC|nr:hypothetical protein TEQG_01587 [Trichophyton equinum CBS 127.97]